MAVEQAVSEGCTIVELIAAISGIVAIGISVITRLWVSKKLQTQKHEHDGQLESLKSELGKKDTVHKLQFEKEFELYEKLWKALVAVRKTVIITLDIETKDSLSCGGEYEKAIEIFNEAKNLFEDNRPFYHDTVSKITRKLLHQCRGYLTEVTKMLKSGKDDKDLSKKAEELLKKVPEAIDEIEKAIQGRIGLLQKAKIVE